MAINKKIKKDNPLLSCPNAYIGHPLDHLKNGFPWAASRLKHAGMTVFA
ncbi:hypothetical protein JXJ21_19840 [candidate division KSB1 bacterium]|nr:hypothetical protein [candidate division KSB1 bacterium]